jgi:hypothetical protein
LTPLPTFGGGDGWRAPNEIVAGDAAGTATGSSYNYLQTAGQEGGIAYNPITGNLILVSRSPAGDGLRILNGTSGVDVGSLNQGSGIISGGTLATHMIATGSDGAVYAANLEANVSTAPFKVYKWSSEGAAGPTLFHDATIAGFGGTPRLGDSLDATGAGDDTTLVAGVGGANGYSVITASGATAVANFSPSTPTFAGFQHGITFVQTPNDVWGKRVGQSSIETSSYSGSSATRIDSNNLGNPNEGPMDFAVVNGNPLLAMLDVNTSVVRVFSFAGQTGPQKELTLIASATTTSGPLAANANQVGSIRFGAIGDNDAVLYAMVGNQGIQAFQLSEVIPEPEGFLMLAIGLLTTVSYRTSRRRFIATS